MSAQVVNSVVVNKEYEKCIESRSVKSVHKGLAGREKKRENNSAVSVRNAQRKRA